jgi:penicillin G amidase
LDGTVYIKGNSAPATVQTESNGFMHVVAANQVDVYRTLGFVSSKQRLLQMDFQRRVGRGNLSVFLGTSAALPIDIYFRQLGWCLPLSFCLPLFCSYKRFHLYRYRKVPSWVKALEPDVRAFCDAYADGVNQGIADYKDAWPIDYWAILSRSGDDSPLPFTCDDVFYAASLISIDLAGNAKDEWDHWLLLANRSIDPSRIQQLLPLHNDFDNAPNFVTPEDVVAAGLNGAALPAVDNSTWLQRNKGRYRSQPSQSGGDARKSSSVGSSQRFPSSVAEAFRSLKLTHGISVGSMGMGLGLPDVDDFALPKQSNNWVIHGRRTASGKPILANDPHLGFSAPAVWMAVHLLSTDGVLNVTGVLFPGMFTIMSGRNKDIAWGVTNTGNDVQDYYVMQESPDGRSYTYKGQQILYDMRQEVFNFPPIDGSDVMCSSTLFVKDCVYGPIVSNPSCLSQKPRDPQDPAFACGSLCNFVNKDFIVPDSVAFHFQAMLTATDPAITAFVRINTAFDWTSFVNATKTYVAPSQNFVFADVSGNIGLVIPGQIPIRKDNHTGLYPVPGDGYTDWLGIIPFDQRPRFLNPTRGFVATANQKPLPSNYRYILGYRWEDTYRARRITDLIVSAGSGITVAQAAEWQQDTVSYSAAKRLPLLKKIIGNPLPQGMETWDYNSSIGSPAACAYNAWVSQLDTLLSRQGQSLRVFVNLPSCVFVIFSQGNR